MVSEAKAMRVKQRHSAKLLRQPGVSGVSVEKGDDGGFVLAIHIDRDDPEIRKNLPRRLDDCPVKIVSSGPFRKLSPTK
jgi:hypothetical protein